MLLYKITLNPYSPSKYEINAKLGYSRRSCVITFKNVSGLLSILMTVIKIMNIIYLVFNLKP